MGNQPSKTDPQAPTPTPSSAPGSQAASSSRKPLKRRDSVVTKSAAAGTVATLESATAQSRASKSQTRSRSSTLEAQAHSSDDATKNIGARTTDKPSLSLPIPTPTRTVYPQRTKSPAPPPITTTFADEAPSATLRQTASPSPIPTPYYLPPSDFHHPPRLPIPLEEDLLSPGSPILSSEDLSYAPNTHEGDALPRRSSVLSATTMGEEEDLGDDVFKPLEPGSTTDILIEWKEGGRKVFVTGTFANNWSKKYRLQESSGKDPKTFSVVVPMIPGTHHVSFLVDGHMRTASHMPTTVDFTNALINYVEVGPITPVKSTKEASHTAAKATTGSRPTTGTHSAMSSMSEPRPATGTGPAQPLVPSRVPVDALVDKPHSPAATKVFRKQQNEAKYHQEIPRFLLELDAPEDSTRYARATAATQTLPTPPSLPMFLSKSILNGSTPMKDDSSVLNLPNHTVLNHLATSSIKSGVLATSATTRYKKKYVTTILYKPTSDKDE